MFTLNKLLSLPHKTMLRKLMLLLQAAEEELVIGKTAKYSLVRPLLSGLKQRLEPKFLDTVERLEVSIETCEIRRLVNILRHGLLAGIGVEPSEWDFIEPRTGVLDDSKRVVYPVMVFLEDLRSPFNVGSIMRTAESFGVSHVYITSATPLPTTKRALRTARGASEVIGWSVASLESIGANDCIFALETNGTPIAEFSFPSQGIALIGSEELGLSPEAIALSKNKCGTVSIPLSGAKRSLNVSVAFGILMFHWFSQIHKPKKLEAWNK